MMHRPGVSNISIIATVLVGLLIVLAMVSYAYYSTNSSLSRLSDQNTNLSGQIAGLDQHVSSLNQQVSSLAQRTLTVVTMTNTVVMVETTTSVTTMTSISTLRVYPVPDNVTVLFTKVSGEYSYSITAGSSIFTGSSSIQESIPLTSLFQGETISISASEIAAGGCAGGQTVTVQLYFNGQLVAQSVTQCIGSPAQITYSV